jgi:hypothetical protein
VAITTETKREELMVGITHALPNTVMTTVLYHGDRRGLEERTPRGETKVDIELASARKI